MMTQTEESVQRLRSEQSPAQRTELRSISNDLDPLNVYHKLVRRSVVLTLALVLCGCGGEGGSSSPNLNDWTILVYMNAANDLSADAPFNIEQMQQAASNPSVKIVVEWKQSTSVSPNASFNGTRRYLIRPGSSAQVQSGLIQDLGTGVDMGRPAALSDFVTWAKASYPAQRYALVLWDHGNGWRPRKRPSKLQRNPAFSYDGETGNAIQIWQLPAALGDQHFDMIVWDCSLMQMAEVAHELQPNTQYVVGSEESPPALGFPYDSILQQFQNNPSASTLGLAETWVDKMDTDANYAADPIEESVIDTAKLSALSPSGGPIDQFASQLIAAMPGIVSTTTTVRQDAKSYDSTQNPPRYYYDLFDLAAKFQSLSNVPTVQKSAAAVMAAIPQAVVYEKHNALSAGSHGLAIDFSPSMAFVPSEADYDQLSFASANQWKNWLELAP